MENQQRTFLAINLSNEIKKELELIIEELASKNRGKDIKWVNSEILHITLHFLGYISKEEIKAVDKLLDTITSKFKQSKLKYNSLDIFPNHQNPKVICITTEKIGDNDSVNKLREAIGKELKELEFKIDKRPWNAHITLGRIKDRRVRKINLGVKLGEIKNEVLEIKSIELMESKLLPEGPVYSVIKSYNLSDK